ncbi:MAG: hypothetical protein H0U46_00660, partial [Actinobacteria bacterium]|nr:hypothetical protein [Actinomycetota bacterium]
MVIATGRYQAREKILESGLAPVGTTVGNPRFKLGYELAGRCGMVAPYGLLGTDLSEEEFEQGFRARLERFGVEEIQTKLEELAGERPGVVLLCFEDVRAG